VLLGSLVAACAGGDTPSRTDELEQQIANEYAPGRVGAAAGAGGGGAGGSSASGAGGSATGNGGSSGTMAGTAGSSGMPVTGTGGSGSTGGACDGFAILKTNCSGGSCHGAGTGFTPFAAEEGDAPNFVGEQSMICGSQDNAAIFDSDTPSASLVVKKILATTSCGGRMPAGATTQALTDEQVACVESWIGSLD
jgi:hypothetical protein